MAQSTRLARVRRTALIAVVLVVTGGAFLSTMPVWAQTPPNSYYGAAESASDTLAPEGTVIVAVANNEVQDSITVETAGRYGSSDPSGKKLRVSSDIDSTVTFHVGNASGPEAAETDPDPTGEVEELDLTFPAGTFGGSSTPTSTPTPTPTSTTTSTPTPTPTTTPTPTATATQTPSQTSTPGTTQTQSDTDTGTGDTGRSGTDAQGGAVTASDTSAPGNGIATSQRATASENGTTTADQGGGGIIPWGLLRAVFLFVGVPILVIYGVLKALAIYYGY